MTNPLDTPLEDNVDYNFDNLQQSWINYWNENGDAKILSSWLIKYSDYMNKIEEGKEESKQTGVQENQEFSVPNKETINENIDEPIGSEYDSEWQLLWNKHCEEQYEIEYQKFYEDFINEINSSGRKKDKFFIKSKLFCRNKEDHIEKYEDPENEVETVEYVTLNESETLESLGLPVSFGCKKSWKGKRSKNQITTENSASDSEIDYISDCNPFFNMNVEALILENQNSKPKSSKNRKRKQKKNPKIPDEIKCNKSLLKYWHRRFSLFELFDRGIQLDEESWFSVTPEKVAKGIAKRLKCNIILDAFCGCGGNTIQFAFECNHVIAIDIDPIKIQLAKNNAKIYGVEHKIDFIVGDFLNICKIFQKNSINTIFLSPPWGGPKYLQKTEYDLEEDLKPISATELIKLCRNLTDNIAIYLPKNSNKNQIGKLCVPNEFVEINENYLNDKIVALTAFYGNLVPFNVNKRKDAWQKEER